MDRLQGKVAIITGGGSGLGRAMALRFVAEGARVLVADIDEAGGQETVAAIGRSGAEDAVAFRRVDVTVEADCEAAVADALARWGRLDVMVANAGIGALGYLATLTREEWDRVIAVNLTGAFLCAKHAFRAMQGAGGGAILITASVAGLGGTPRLGAYGPSKAGAIQLMQTLALEGARFNIRANALCPVWTATPMVDAFVSGLTPQDPDQLR
ncbi:MAG TPA: SDR family NAD(P)-dependent oxidoreductase, partial [Gemmatimonadales bacterium]|nr:SDR family NAD(P)-dependent oxidoreductase [Gemmatimonadales bacterium]